MRGYFGHESGQGPFGHHGPFEHHGPFGHHRPFGHHGPFEHHGPSGHHGPSRHHGPFEHHGPSGHHGPFEHHGPFGHHGPSGHHGPFGSNHRGPCGDRDCNLPCEQRPGQSHGIVRDTEGLGFRGGPVDHHEPEPCRRHGRCDAREERDCSHNRGDQERSCGRPCGPSSPERRHRHHGPRGDFCNRIGPHSPDRDDVEERCCRIRDRSGERRSRGTRHGLGLDRHRRYGSPGLIGHGHFRPHGHGPHRRPLGMFGPWNRPQTDNCLDNCCRRRCSKGAQHSEDESGNETEKRCGRKNRRNCSKNKDDNRDTVFVQRIVVEKTPRCYSV